MTETGKPHSLRGVGVSGNMSGRTRNTKAGSTERGARGRPHFPEPEHIPTRVSGFRGNSHDIQSAARKCTFQRRLLDSCSLASTFLHPRKASRAHWVTTPHFPVPRLRAPPSSVSMALPVPVEPVKGVVSCVTLSLSSFSLPSAFAGHPSRSTCQDMAPCAAAFVWPLPHC